MPSPPSPLVLQNCCLRADGSVYAHPGCGCPQAVVVAVSTHKRAEMCGWCEFGPPSTPLRCYRQYSLDGHWSWTKGSQPGAPSPVPIWQETINGLGASDWKWNAETGALEPASPAPLPDDYSIEITNFNHESGADFTLENNLAQNCLKAFNVFPQYSSPPEPTRPVVPFSGTPVVVSPTIATFSVANATLDGSEGGSAYRWTISAGTLTLELSDEDTEDDALARAEPYEFRGGDAYAPDGLENVFTLREARADDAVNFSELRTHFALICRNLVPGLHYQAIVTFQRRTATGLGLYAYEGYDAAYGAWEDVEERFESEVFEAEAEEQVVGGAFDDPDEDGEISADEVTPETAMPGAAGYQYRISGVFVEMAEAGAE